MNEIRLYDEQTNIHVPKTKVNKEKYYIHDRDRLIVLSTLAFRFNPDHYDLRKFFIIVHKIHHNEDLFNLNYEVFNKLGFKEGELVKFIYGSKRDSEIIRLAIREHDEFAEKIKQTLDENDAVVIDFADFADFT